jgi:type 1 glutamine amidotransferase
VQPKVLVFSKTAGYRHASIPDGIAAIQRLGAANQFAVDASWPWYGHLVGAYFRSHPAIQPASVSIEDFTNPSTAFLPANWQRTDEWYNFATNPRGSVHVLATVDENTYSGGTMGSDHPIAWCHLYDGGRAWYTAGGHTIQSYSEPLFQRHILGGIEYAAAMKAANCQ